MDKIFTKRHNFSSKKTSRTSRKWVIYFQGGGWCAPNWLAHLDGYSILDANAAPSCDGNRCGLGVTKAVFERQKNLEAPEMQKIGDFSVVSAE